MFNKLKFHWVITDPGMQKVYADVETTEKVKFNLNSFSGTFQCRLFCEPVTM